MNDCIDCGRARRGARVRATDAPGTVQVGSADRCQPCHRRFIKDNGPQPRRWKSVSLEERIWPRVEKTPQCWEWTGPKTNGYGVITYPGGRGGRAHRLAWELTRGPIPEGLHLDHLCRNRGCVNPDHLEAVTPAENNRRAMAYAMSVRTTCRRGHDRATHSFPSDSSRCRTCNHMMTKAREAAQR